MRGRVTQVGEICLTFFDVLETAGPVVPEEEMCEGDGDEGCTEDVAKKCSEERPVTGFTCVLSRAGIHSGGIETYFLI